MNPFALRRVLGLCFRLAVWNIFIGLLVLQTSATPPNIIVIVADDLGWHDLGVQGATDLKTPSIDALAASGARFTRGYVTAPVCSPSRAALMTGRYQQRFGHETNPGTSLERDPHFGLPLTEATLGDRMKALGYTTGWIGKSHLGGDTNLYHPLKRGFDEFFGFIEGHHHYFPEPVELGEQEDPILRGYTPIMESNYLTEAFTRECVSFITNHANGPFFLYAPFNATHFFLEAPPYLLSEFSPTNFIGNQNRRTNAAMLLGLDMAVSNLVLTLRNQGIETNTLIFFTSDNGGATDFGSINTPLRGGKSDVYEGGVRVPFLVSWPGHIPSNTVLNGLVSTLDILPTCLAAAGTNAPGAWQLDGVSLLPYATGATTASPHTNLYWRIETNGSANDDVKDGVRAVRSGNWKLVKQGIAEDWELYDLTADPGETNNLASVRPDILQQLVASYEAWNVQLAPGRWARDDLNYRAPELIREDIRLGATNVSYLDPEFLPGGAQFAFRDGSSNLWVGGLDPLTGWLVSADGADVRVDTNLPPPIASLNALAWGLSTNSPALFYTKQTPAGKRQVFRARTVGNTLVKTQLTSAATNESFGVRPSQEAANLTVKLAFNFGSVTSSVPVVADELAVGSAVPLPQPVPGTDNGAWIPGSKDLVYAGYPSGVPPSQLMRLATGPGTTTVLTDLPGEKSEVCAFLAPELGGELLYAAVVGGTNFTVYRDAHDNTNGYFTPLFTAVLPTNTPQGFIHSLRPLPGGRGYNGVSYFTCVGQQNADPLNPGNGAVFLLGLGPTMSNAILRRLDGGGLGDRRDPKLSVGNSEVFCYYSLYDGGNPVQLRLTQTGIRSPDHVGDPSGFAGLALTRSFTPGGAATGSNAMNPTEITALVPHQGRLFAATGSKGFRPYPTDDEILSNAPAANWSGAVILVKDSPTSDWRVDDTEPDDLFRVHIRAETLTEITLTTDRAGNIFPQPTNLLVCGLADIGTIGAYAASARLRDDATGRWNDSHVATTTEPANTISFGAHRSSFGTNLLVIHNVFAGLSNGQIQRGAYSTNTGNLEWSDTPEPLDGPGAVTGFAEAGGRLYAACGLRQTASNAPVRGGVYVRNDLTRSWSPVYQPAPPVALYDRTNEDFILSGLTAVPNPNGDENQVLLVARAWPGVIERIEPANNHAIVTELDVRDFYARHWGDDRVRTGAVSIAYSGFTAVTNPVTGERVQLIGVRLGVPGTSAHFLIRHGDGTYETAEIPNDGAPAGLRATRCAAPSPFAGERYSVYFGGFDAGNDTVTNTAWIARGDWQEWPAVDLAHDNTEWLAAWPYTGTDWLLESSPVLGAFANWQPAPGLPTRSVFGSVQNVPAPSTNGFFRLRKP